VLWRWDRSLVVGLAPSSPIFKLGALGPHRCKWPNGVEGFRLSQTPWAGKVA
jgi:hypothetical protein